jgi:hypothetical protein
LFVDAGRFAQNNAAPLSGAAALVGEADQPFNKWSYRDSNPKFHHAMVA